MYCFIIYLFLISSFLHTGSLLVPCAYVSIKSIDCILLSSFELKAILLFVSVKTSCFLLLNLFYVFNINLLFLYKLFMIFFKTVYINFIFCKWFVLFSIWATSKRFLYSSKLNFLFMTHFFVLLLFYLPCCCLLNSYMSSVVTSSTLIKWVF